MTSAGVGEEVVSVEDELYPPSEGEYSPPRWRIKFASSGDVIISRVVAANPTFLAHLRQFLRRKKGRNSSFFPLRGRFFPNRS